jgi:hypothetical protein
MRRGEILGHWAGSLFFMDDIALICDTEKPFGEEIVSS